MSKSRSIFRTRPTHREKSHGASSSLVTCTKDIQRSSLEFHRPSRLHAMFRRPWGQQGQESHIVGNECQRQWGTRSELRCTTYTDASPLRLSTQPKHLAPPTIRQPLSVRSRPSRWPLVNLDPQGAGLAGGPSCVMRTGTAWVYKAWRAGPAPV